MNSKTMLKLIQNFYPGIIILLLLVFKYISFTNFIFGYLTYCIYIYYTSKTKLSYVKTEFNNNLLNNCPSIKNPNYKPYYYLPFKFMQFILARYSIQTNFNEDIVLKEESVDGEGTNIIWASYKNTENNHSNPVLFILPGITGKTSDAYVKNIITTGLKNNYDVIIFQMRTLSDKMKMPKNNKYVNFCDDINETLKKIKTINNNKLYAIGYSYGANLLTTYLGTKNIETHYIEAGISICNPFDCFMNQRLGEDTLYEPVMLHFEKKNYIPTALALNKQKENFIDINALRSSVFIREFDREFFGKILGYRKGDDYYRGISSYKYINDINIPYLVINSKDDPICTSKNIPFDDIDDNKNIIFILTDKGAHSCYVENEKNFSISVKQWMLKPAIEFLNYLKNLKN